MKRIEKLSAADFPTAVRDGVVLVDFFAQYVRFIGPLWFYTIGTISPQTIEMEDLL